MEIFVNNSNNVIYEWTDRTSSDIAFIKQNLCNRCEDILYKNNNNNNYTNNNTIYYTYIGNKNSNCWNITSIYTLTMCTVCGPQMSVSTRYYWILHIYIPTILGVFGTIYIFYIFIYLRYNVYIFEHNWLLEPTKHIKRSAVLLPLILSMIFFLGFIYYIILIIGYKKTGIFSTLHIIDTDYPFTIYLFWINNCNR